ncbi:hypothetical protein [Mycobacterium paraterrae]|uniref:Uncharacterized protein n=1 Tax=Mycobacterium paraterrae TaxID=577492 RepID=A0ABY5U8P2_9MYCO|nr:hypothetical protein [Mycobacterium paraterrae]UWI82306.1 hypothetical protein MKK62_26375 [Mycobacterium paraterrae]
MSRPTGDDHEWQSSADERDPDASRDAEERERWLRDNVPPHHG